MFRASGSWKVRGIAAALILAFSFAGCGGDPDEPSTEVTVLAAASLTEAFTELGEIYESENSGTKVVFSFAGSSDLAGQINSGAPADVFASADEPNMEMVAGQDLIEGGSVIFARNVLEIALPQGNPGRIKGLADFSRKDLKIAVCAPEVPCGNAAETLFEEAGIEPSVDSFEPDVKSVLTKVELDEVDAGLVYHSDILAAGDSVESIYVPESGRAINSYPIALLTEGDNPDGGRAFIDLVLSPDGVEKLEEHGFRGP